MTTLVTGATGFIGRHVARRLMERGERVRFFCRGESGLDTELRNSTCIDVAQGDMRDKRSLERAVAGATRVIHLAAAMSGSEEYFQAATVQGSRDILEVATTAGVRRFVYVSSMSVYDFSKVPEGGLVDEESPLETQLALRNDYARAKSQADAIARQHMRRGVLPMCIVRPGAVYGPGGKAPILSTLLSFGGKVLFLIGGGRRQIPLIYVENLVDALLLMLESEAAVSRIYNLVDADPPSERLYLGTLLQIKSAKALIVPLPRWPFLVGAHLVQLYRDWRGETRALHLVHGIRRVTGYVRFAASAARRELGWTSRVAFRDAMWATYGSGEAGAGGVSRNAAIGDVARRDA